VLVRDEHGQCVGWYAAMIDIDVKNRDNSGLRELSLDDALDKIASATSLRELSASIAHEVNQPLAAIVATCHACRRWLSADPPNLERAKITLERIVRDANSASEFVGRIREKFDQMDNARSKADETLPIEVRDAT
jgi:C4-dicarboxylate-specific signal transduction histidine kinase